MKKLPCQSYKNLPEVAGVCSLAEATEAGLSVQACVDRLKRYHYALHRIWQIFNARLTSEPIYEIKMALSLHIHLCAQQVTAMRDRVAEMRHPPLGLDKVPHPALQLFFDEIIHAPHTIDLISAVYSKALPALKQALESHLRDTNKLADWPTVRVCKFALIDLEEMLAWGKQAIECLADEPKSERLQEWLDSLDGFLDAAGGLDGTRRKSEATPSQRFSLAPFHYARTPRRDHRFPDPYNMGVHAEEFLYDPKFPARVKTLMIYYKRLREIDVPEMMAGILLESIGKPWEFHRDMSRQLWDEARHAMMGEAGFVKLGINWPDFVMVNFTWSKGLNEQLKPEERHAVLWFIEQGLMNKTGKRFEWEVGRESGDPLSTLFQDYDWADEVLHARIGRDWYVSLFNDDVEKAAKYGGDCWSKVVSGWSQWKAEGLTQHRNWWPGLYDEYCRIRGEAPDPAVEAFDVNYSQTRADLQRIASSG